ncbi:MAG TPA: calcium/proton exchanger [Candidatus Thermoplasmatota archaeon]|jgi:Ca2+:H+ antiporter|nr:calcium/proton exchanger [Candidatus Thermoplasmatota archaeon]
MEARLRRFSIRPHRAPAHGPLPRLAYLALLAPVAFAASAAHAPAVAFPLGAMALVGAAFLLGEAAEVVALRLGEGLGSLVTASLSNLVTLTIVGAALVEGLYGVVHAAIIGAILGNVLFALGGAMLLGGVGREKQSFGREAAAVNATLLMMASFALLMPAIVGRLAADRDPLVTEKLTIPISLVLLGTYFIGLLFSTRTHKHLFNPAAADEEERHRAHPAIVKHPLPVLAGTVLLVGAMAETVAENLQPVGAASGIPSLFLGIVVIGIITNSVEIATAWRMARKDHMNVAIQVATGSGIQVMLFVTPILVFLSLLLPTGLLSLEFPMAMVVAVGMAAVLVNIVASDGESTWYEGVLLLALYAIVASVFLVLPT